MKKNKLITTVLKPIYTEYSCYVVNFSDTVFLKENRKYCPYINIETGWCSLYDGSVAEREGMRLFRCIRETR